MTDIKKKTNPAPSIKTTATGKPGTTHETQPRTRPASTPKAPQKKKTTM